MTPLLLIGPLLLAGCATPASSPAVIATSNPCDFLPLKAYTQAFNAALADEIDAAPPGAHWPEAIEGYIALRDSVKACRSTKP